MDKGMFYKVRYTICKVQYTIDNGIYVSIYVVKITQALGVLEIKNQALRLPPLRPWCFISRTPLPRAFHYTNWGGLQSRIYK